MNTHKVSASDVNLSDGIKSVLGFGGLNLSRENLSIYEELFWKALREGAMSLGEALSEVLCQLCVEEAEAERLKALFNEAAFSRSTPRITIYGQQE